MKYSKYADENNIINLFFLEGNFYAESGSIMSSIYHVETKKRWHWGFVQVALEKGYEMNIRPANDEEMEWAKNKLEELKEEREDE